MKLELHQNWIELLDLGKYYIRNLSSGKWIRDLKWEGGILIPDIDLRLGLALFKSYKRVRDKEQNSQVSSMSLRQGLNLIQCRGDETETRPCRKFTKTRRASSASNSNLPAWLLILNCLYDSEFKILYF